MDQFSKEELLEIYDNLNSFIWDYRLGLKPDGYDDMPVKSKETSQTKRKAIRPYMKLLSSFLNEKEILKYHHINNLNRTESEFEWWWIKRKIRITITGDPF